MPIQKERLPLESQQQRATKTQKWLIGILLVILLAFVGSYLYLNHYYSRSATTNRFVTAIEQNDSKTVSSLIRTDDPDFKVTLHSVQPLMAYYQNHPNQRAKLKRRMAATGVVNGVLDFVDTGHHFFIFEKYLLEVKPIFPTINANQDNTQVKINNRIVAKSLNKSVTPTFGPYIPGRYNIIMTSNNHGKTKIVSRTFEWIDPSPQSLHIQENFK